MPYLDANNNIIPDSVVGQNILNNPRPGPQQYAGGPFASDPNDVSGKGVVPANINSVLPVGGSVPNSPVNDSDIANAVKKQEQRSDEIFEKGREVSGKISKQAENIEAMNPPKPPTISPPNPPKGTDPWQEFGSPAMTLAIFGSMATRQGLNGALEAGAGVMQARKDNDAAAAKKYMEDYKQYVDYVKQQHEFEKNFYEEGLEKAGKDVNAQKAALEAMTSAFKDTNLSSLVAIKGMQGYYDEMKKRQTLNDKLTSAQLEVTATEAEKQKIAEEKAAGTKITPLQEQERLNQARILAHATMTEDEAKTYGEKYAITNQMPPQGLGNTPESKANRALIMKYGAVGANGKSVSGAELAAKEVGFQGEKSEARALGTQTAKLQTAGREADNLGDLLIKASNDVPRTDLPNFNKLLLAAEEKSGGTKVIAYSAALNSYINAYSRAINPNGVATVAGNEHARAMLQAAYSKGQIEAGVNQLKLETKQAREAPEFVKALMQSDMTGKVNAPTGAIQHLKDNHDLSAAFDEKYGAGSAAKILGGQ